MGIAVDISERLSVAIESGFTVVGAELLTAAADGVTYSSSITRFSLCEKDEAGIDRRAVVRRDGLRNGCFVSPAASATSMAVDVADGSLFIAGVQLPVAAVADLQVTRPTLAVKIVSLVASGLGNIYLLDGTEAAAASAIRGAAGGAPFVPVNEVELATVTAYADVTHILNSGDISFRPELSSFPAWEVLPYDGKIRFYNQPAIIHTGSTSAKVYGTFHLPQMVQVDVSYLKQPVVTAEFNSASGGIFRKGGDERAGRLTLPMTAGNAPLLDVGGSVRLMELMADSTVNRRRAWFLYLEEATEFRPSEIRYLDFNLIPVEEPREELF